MADDEYTFDIRTELFLDKFEAAHGEMSGRTPEDESVSLESVGGADLPLVKAWFQARRRYGDGTVEQFSVLLTPEMAHDVARRLIRAAEGAPRG